TTPKCFVCSTAGSAWSSSSRPPTPSARSRCCRRPAKGCIASASSCPARRTGPKRSSCDRRRRRRFAHGGMAQARITVLLSGRGSNLEALVAAERAGRLAGTVCAVISNRAGVPALAFAEASGIATYVVEHRAYADREAFEAALVAAVDASRPDLIVLAGF